MEKRMSHFEDHLNVVTGTEKTAGAKNSLDLLDKLANELGFNKKAQEDTGAVTAPAAPTAEGEVIPAASSVAGAAPAVVAATEAVATPQTTIAGGNPAEAAAGEMPAQTKPNEGLAISAGDGKITDANQLHKTPESIAAAAVEGGGNEGGASTPNPLTASSVPDNSLGAEKTAEAVKIGRLIATSFQQTLEKQSQDSQYSEALGILKAAGILDNYKINDPGINKTASLIETEGCLEKIASNKPLSRNDIVGAAIEYVEFEKQASDVEEQARVDAQEFIKEAAEADTLGRQAAHEYAAGLIEQEETKQAAEVEAGENEKVAALMEDKDVVKAVQVLKVRGLL